MCRWLAYGGPPIRIGGLLFEPEHSIVRQSLDAREGATPVNGDGFGLGWYDHDDPVPCRYRGVRPAWNDVNLRDVTRNLRSRSFLAHVRASTGTAVQVSNCHPFQHGTWMFCHNGIIEGFDRMRRALMLAIDPDLFDSVERTTDSEVLFHLALTFGLERDPHGALERAVGFVEATGRSLEIQELCVQMTVGMTDGSTVYAARYATHGTPRSLYHSTEMPTLKRLCPDHPDVQSMVTEDIHLVVSEPLDDLPGSWSEVPANTFVTMASGRATSLPFAPVAPRLSSDHPERRCSAEAVVDEGHDET